MIPFGQQIGEAVAFNHVGPSSLSDITQQLYLGLPAYWEWRRDRRRRSKQPAQH